MVGLRIIINKRHLQTQKRIKKNIWLIKARWTV